MAETLKLEIVTPDAVVYSQDVHMVTLPAVEGQIGIYPMHIPLMTQIVPGEIIVLKDGRESFLAVGEGVVEVTSHRVAIVTPQRGDKRRLVAMAQANAAQSFRARRDVEAQARAQVEELRRRLRLAMAPSHIECVDIATFQGGETVGALVAFRDGRPWKDGYRRFRMRAVTGTDDFASVAEVLRRRFRADGRHGEPPDLLVIDGGATERGIESTIVAATGDGPLRLLRRGPIDVEAPETSDRIEAPGQLASHYAPRKPLRLDAGKAEEGEYMIGFGPVGGDVTLSETGDPIEAAARLFDLLHQADAAPHARIAIAPVPGNGIAAAIRDRLKRAAAPRP